MNKLKIVFSVVILSGIFISSCKKPTTTTITSEQTVETRLNAFVLTLVSNPPTSADIANRVKLYIKKLKEKLEKIFYTVFHKDFKV